MDFVFDGPVGETPWPIKILLLQLYNSTLSFIEIWEKIQCQNNNKIFMDFVGGLGQSKYHYNNCLVVLYFYNNLGKNSLSK